MMWKICLARSLVNYSPSSRKDHLVLRKMKKKCPRCEHKYMFLIDTCVIYDKYYICENCGYCDFRNSKKLSKEENKKRLKALGVRMNVSL